MDESSLHGNYFAQKCSSDFSSTFPLAVFHAALQVNERLKMATVFRIPDSGIPLPSFTFQFVPGLTQSAHYLPSKYNAPVSAVFSYLQLWLLHELFNSLPDLG